MGNRQLRLGAFMRPVSIRVAAWRDPGGSPDANFNFPLLKRFARKLDHGKFDAFFMADHLAVPNLPIDGLKRSATIFRRAYEGRALRETLDLPRPDNRCFANGRAPE